MNYFEMIKASPACDERQLTIHIQRAGDLPTHKRNEALQILLNPRRRMYQEIKTFRDPSYDSALSDHKYTEFIGYLLDDKTYASMVSPNLTSYLYRKFEAHEDYNNLNGGEEARTTLYDLISKDLAKDPWVQHSLALLYERYSLYCDENGDLHKSLDMLEKSISYWVKLLEQENFYQHFYTYQQANNEKRKQECAEVWFGVFEDLVKAQHDKFSTQLGRGDLKKAALHYNLVHKLSAHKQLEKSANNTLDMMITDLIQKLDSIFTSGASGINISGNYDAVFDFLDQINLKIARSQRLLLYELGKYSQYLYELILAKDFERAGKKMPAVDKVIKNLKAVKSASNPSFIIDQEINKVAVRYKGLGIEQTNSVLEALNLKDLHKALDLKDVIKALKDKEITFERAKQELNQAISFLEKAVKYGAEGAQEQLDKVKEIKKQVDLFELLSQTGIYSGTTPKPKPGPTPAPKPTPKPRPTREKSKTGIGAGKALSQVALILVFAGLTYAVFFLTYNHITIPLLGIMAMSWMAARFRWWA